MKNAGRARNKLETFQYIGATGQGVYLESTRFRLFGTGSRTIVWTAPRSEFTDADIRSLEKGRKRGAASGR
jgi:hypothetical protein